MWLVNTFVGRVATEIWFSGGTDGVSLEGDDRHFCVVGSSWL